MALKDDIAAGVSAAGCAAFDKGGDGLAAVALGSLVTGAFLPALGFAAAAAAAKTAAVAAGCNYNPVKPPGLNPPCWLTGGGWSSTTSGSNELWRNAGTAVAANGTTSQLPRYRMGFFPAATTVGFRKKADGVNTEFFWQKGANSGLVTTDQATGGWSQHPGYTTNPPAGETATNTNPGCGGTTTDLTVYDYTVNNLTFRLNEVYLNNRYEMVANWKVTNNNGDVYNVTKNYTTNNFSFGGGPGGGGGGGGERPWWMPDEDQFYAFLKLLFDQLMSQRPGSLYRLTSVCETNASCEPVDKAVEVTTGGGFWGDEVLDRLDNMVPLLQGLKDFKQPVCQTEVIQPQGELVSVRFVSLEKSSGGKAPLRKEFRYRDQSYADQCAHANHWEGFEWDAGPVQVISTGLSWGKPQVWASTAAEGKRVIGHAAAIAGVDLSLPCHKWTVATTASARVGRAGRMVPDRKALNSIWVTKRDGSSGLPEFPIAI